MADRMETFLAEMACLAGQDAEPILELQLGNVRTLTMLSQEGEALALSISALLPRNERFGYLEASLSDGKVCGGGRRDTSCLWHADEGCYAMVRNIPLRQFSDERSIFDAILDTADQAESWYAFLQARLARPH